MKRQKIACCWYDIEDHEDNDIDSDQRFPMLAREQFSSIKFKNVKLFNNAPIFKLLNELYETKDDYHRIINALMQKRVNPIINIQHEHREDLEYYIPQLLTFLVIECDLANKNLIKLVLRGCATDFYFAHYTFFYLKSLTMNNQGVEIKKVSDFINGQFLQAMKMYEKNRLSGFQFSKSMIKMDPQWTNNHFKQINEGLINEEENNNQNRNYGRKAYQQPRPDYPPIIKKVQNKIYHKDGFLQTPTFLDDLIQIGDQLRYIEQNKRSSYLEQAIMEKINPKLPANVYIPFFKDNIRLYTVLCVWKNILFSTKARAPYSIWVQLYREEEECIIQGEKGQINENKRKTFFEKIKQTLSKPFNISENNNTLNIKKYIAEKIANIEIKFEKKRERFNSFNEEISENNFGNRLSISEFYEFKSEGKKSSKSSISSTDKEVEQISADGDYFPNKFENQVKQIWKKSIYRKLKSWKVLHFMVKVGDDLKQQQFAMQLIWTFQKIFKQQKVDCNVYPYEVISLGPNSGLIQMLNDVITLDSLFRKLQSNQMSLKQFFDSNFKDKDGAKTNFMRSLAGYSLVTYFLQVKDRHNGNILLHRDGSIIHIDFGFLLSNVPGKGLQLESKVAFKLLSQYVQVMGSLNSEMFFKFRELFLKGFRAILKHKQIIISLVKMMYSSHGDSMACFIKGEDAVWALENRFYPQANTEQFCYDLINNSLDHWRAKWYDKFQYFLQKIYY